MHWQAANCGTAVPAIPLGMMDTAYPAARSNRPFSLDEFPPKRRNPGLGSMADVENAQFAALGEADPCRRHPDHPQRRQQYGSTIQAERAVPRTEAGVAVLAVVLGVLQRHRT